MDDLDVGKCAICGEFHNLDEMGLNPDGSLICLLCENKLIKNEYLEDKLLEDKLKEVGHGNV